MTPQEQNPIMLLLTKNLKQGSNGFFGIFGEIDPRLEIRLDPLKTSKKGFLKDNPSYTIISPQKLRRSFEVLSQDVETQEFTSFSGKNDILCKILKGEVPAVIIAKDKKLIQESSTNSEKHENLGKYKAVTFLEAKSQFFTSHHAVNPSLEYFFNTKAFPWGAFLVHTFTQHFECLEMVPQDHINALLFNIIKSLKAFKKYLKEVNPFPKSEFEAVTETTFFNIGPKAGALVNHLYAQSFLKFGDFFPKNLQSLPKIEEEQDEKNHPCLACAMAKKDVDDDFFGQKLRIERRTIYENSHWIVLAAFAPERDGHVRFIPKRHINKLTELKTSEVRALSKALKLTNWVLTSFVRDFTDQIQVLLDRYIIFRTGKNFQHMFIDLYPAQISGALELFGKYKICAIKPEKIAEIMAKYAENIRNFV